MAQQLRVRVALVEKEKENKKKAKSLNKLFAVREIHKFQIRI